MNELIFARDIEAVRAIRALRILRNHIRHQKQTMNGHDLLVEIRSDQAPKEAETGITNSGFLLPARLLWDQPIRTIHILLDSGLVQVEHNSDGEMSAVEFKKLANPTGGTYDISNFQFSLSANFYETMGALGISSLTVLENMVKGQVIAVKPLFEMPVNRGTGIMRTEVFVMMPFSPAMRPVYDDAIRPAAKALDLSIARADDLFAKQSIINNMWAAIYTCDLVVADCSGRNVNVFYELGIAHTVGKPTVILAQSEEDIPFDIRHLQCILYEQTPAGLGYLKDKLIKVMPLLLKQDLSNP